MTLSQLSIRRKVAMTCVILMLVILGIFAYRKIGIDLLPKFDVPYVQVTAIYPGASPEEIEVETGITSDGFVEILNPEAVEGQAIIVSGQYFVNDGSDVNVTALK